PRVIVILPFRRRGQRDHVQRHVVVEPEAQVGLAAELFVRVHRYERRVTALPINVEQIGAVQPSFIREVPHEGVEREPIRNEWAVKGALEVVVVRGVERQVTEGFGISVLDAVDDVLLTVPTDEEVLTYLSLVGQVAARVGLEAASQPPPTLLGHDVDDPGHCLTILGVERTRDHLQFFDRVVFHFDRDRSVVGVGHAHAVDEVGHLARPAATYVQASTTHRYAGLSGQQVANLLHRQVLYRLRRHTRFRAGQVFSDDFILCGNDDLLTLQHFLSQLKIDGGRQIDADPDVFSFLGRVSYKGSRYGVRAGANADDHVVTVRTRSRAKRGPIDNHVDPG